MRKYTVNGSNTIESKIASDMETIVRRVTTVLDESDLVSIILGGGYGRGEGGVRLQDGTETLFNDYDLFIISQPLTHFKAKAYQHKLKHLSEELSAEIGIEVDFSRIQAVTTLPKAEFWLFWYEVKYGHIVIWGNPKVLRYLPAWNGENIPLEEASKLLLNRGVGLHLAKERIDSADFDAKDEFIARNMFKAIMALGDTILMCEKKYHWSYQERQKRFASLSSHPLVMRFNLMDMYMESIKYKLNPFDVIYDKAGYISWYNEILTVFQSVYYDIFSHILEAHILDVRSYLAHLNKRFYTQVGSKDTLKNIVLNLRDHHGKGILQEVNLRYPRYRLFYSLPWFLFHENLELYRLDEVLGLPEQSSNETRLRQFMSLWQKYN